MLLAVVFVPRRSRVVWTPGMPPKRKDSRRNRDAPALSFRVSLLLSGCQLVANYGPTKALRRRDALYHNTKSIDFDEGSSCQQTTQRHSYCKFGRCASILAKSFAPKL